MFSVSHFNFPDSKQFNLEDEEGNPIVKEGIVSEEGGENSADSSSPKEDGNDNAIAEEKPENE